jgi:hypothetical protein
MNRQAAAPAVLLALFGALIAATPVRSAAAGAADGELPTLMQLLAARRHAHATFVERKTLAVLSRPVESSGELLYDAPDRLEKRTLKPKAETLLLENGRLSVRRGKRSYDMALRDAPQAAPFIDTIRATLAGDLPALQRGYTLEFHTVPGGWTLQMTPRDAQLLRLVTRVSIRGAGTALGEVTIDSADGDRSVMTIRELPEP